VTLDVNKPARHSPHTILGEYIPTDIPNKQKSTLMEYLGMTNPFSCKKKKKIQAKKIINAAIITKHLFSSYFILSLLFYR
jgi:hypothetical protein